MCRWRGFRWDMNVPDIMHDLKNVCEMLLKILVGKRSNGWYAYWNKDCKHRLYCKLYDIFPEVHDDNNPLPWRLTPEDVQNLDRRVNNMWWPHYTDILTRKGVSFWKKTNRIWKSAHKSMILLVRVSHACHMRVTCCFCRVKI